MAQSNHTIIVGGGIIGLCCAYYLHKNKQAVTVIDRTEITDNCSFGNMGYFSPSHFMPLARPGIITEGLLHLFNSKSPFYIKPRLNKELLQWAWHFKRNARSKRALQNAVHLNDILQLSRSLINEVRKDIGDDFKMEEKGCFMLCRTSSGLQHEEKLMSMAEQFGLQVEKLSRQKVQEMEEHVETNVIGAIWFKDDCHIHPGMFMHSLKKYLSENGVQFILNEEVSAFEKIENKVTAVITQNQKLETGHVIIAAGSWLAQVAKLLHTHILLQPGKGYSHTYEEVEKNILYPAILVEGRCAITPWQHRLRIGGTMEFSGMNHEILMRRMQGIYQNIKMYYPGLQITMPEQENVWCGLRPVSPDGLPYIGKMPGFDNVVIAGGHAMLGISQCTGTGLLVSQIIQNKPTEMNIHPFRVNRF